MTVNRWTPFRFSEDNLYAGTENLKDMYYSGLGLFLNSNYAVATVKEAMSSEVLENKIVNEWHDYITGRDEGKGARLYRIATRFYEEFEVNKGVIFEVEKAKGNWQNQLELLLKIGKQKEEAEVREAVKEYVKDKGIVGIVGNVGNVDLEQCYNAENIRITEILDYKLDLLKLFREFKWDYNRTIIETKGEAFDLGQLKSPREQRAWMNYLFCQMLKEKEDGYGIKSVYETVKDKSYLKKYSGNTNLGLEELKSIFLKHESLWTYETELETSTNKLEFYSIEEIEEFLVDYYRLANKAEDTESIVDLKDTWSNPVSLVRTNKTKRNFTKRLTLHQATEDESNEMLIGMLGCILDDEEKEIFKQLIKEERTAESNDNIWMKVEDTRYGRVSFLFDYEEYISLGLIKRKIPLPLMSHYKMSIVSMMTERNLRDLLIWIDGLTGPSVGTLVQQMVEKALYYANPLTGCCYIPQRNFYTPQIHEAYASALKRNIIQTRVKKYDKIWTSLISNYFKEENGQITMTEDIKKVMSAEYDLIVNLDSDNGNLHKELTDTKLSQMLRGNQKRDTSMKFKKEIVSRIARWLNSTGMYDFDPNRYGDFKVIYDLLFRCKLDAELKDEKNPISIRKMNGKVDATEEFTQEEKAYLILGTFISKLYNRQDLSVDDFTSICLNVRKAIQLHSEIMEIVNDDFILIQTNAFRMAARDTLVKCYNEFGI